VCCGAHLVCYVFGLRSLLLFYVHMCVCLSVCWVFFVFVICAVFIVYFNVCGISSGVDMVVLVILSCDCFEFSRFTLCRCWCFTCRCVSLLV
jgi:hypothetical protein